MRMGSKASKLWQDFWGVRMLLKWKKRARAEKMSRHTKWIAMGIYRTREPWSSGSLIGGLKKLYII